MTQIPGEGDKNPLESKFEEVIQRPDRLILDQYKEHLLTIGAVEEAHRVHQLSEVLAGLIPKARLAVAQDEVASKGS